MLLQISLSTVGYPEYRPRTCQFQRRNSTL